jgi:hypothetical protein
MLLGAVFDPQGGVICSSETSLIRYRATQRHITEDRCQNLNSKSFANSSIILSETGRACSTHDGDDCVAGKPEGKRPLGRHRLRWEDNIEIDLR